MKFEGKRVLIVEDEFIVGIGIALEVDAAGAEAIGPVDNVKAALEIIATTDIDVAILDVLLRSETAFKVADALAARQIPFVFGTAVMRAGEAPARHVPAPCIEKPFIPGIVLDALEGVMVRERGGAKSCDGRGVFIDMLEVWQFNANACTYLQRYAAAASSLRCGTSKTGGGNAKRYR